MTIMMFLAEVTTGAGLGQVLEDISLIYSKLIANVGEVFQVIQTYPIALIPIGVSLAFISVKFCKYILGL